MEKDKMEEQQMADQYMMVKRLNDELQLALETLHEEKDMLQKALAEAELKNEIIAAIGKNYYHITRIDIEEDYYEVVSGFENFPDSIKTKGSFSENVPPNCKKIVDSAYLEDFLAFMDISTLAQRLQNEESISTEYRLVNGNWSNTRLIVKKRNEQGIVTHVLCAIRNISNQKRKEQELAKKAAEAKREVMQKTRFLSNMSHDIRTPMNGILGMIDIAEQYPDDLEVQARCRNKVREMSRYLSSMVNDILDMNKLQSDDFVIPDIPFDLTDMLRAANEAARIKAEEKQIEYIIDWEKGSMSHQYLRGNPIYVAKILSILADNAIKFSDSGSSIVVSCTEKQISNDKLTLTFCCEDHGCGMSKEFTKHAFDLFAQEDESSRTRYQGIGLGLAIAKGLTDRLHGTIRLESEPGAGTTAIVEIPFQTCSRDDVKITGNDDNFISLEGVRVLLVEDNELNMEIARCVLEDQGLLAECASDGLEAVTMFEQSAPGYYQVILMDIMMPNLNGLEAARKIRALKRRDAGEIPIIAMSANAFAEDMIKSRLAGMNAHLAKPLERKKTIETIRRSLSGNKGDNKGEN